MALPMSRESKSGLAVETLEQRGRGGSIGEGTLGVEEGAVLPCEPRVHCLLVLRQTRQVRVDGVDGEPCKGVVGSRLLHLANRPQPASLLLHSGKVESRLNKVDAIHHPTNPGQCSSFLIIAKVEAATLCIVWALVLVAGVR